MQYFEIICHECHTLGPKNGFLANSYLPFPFLKKQPVEKTTIGKGNPEVAEL